MYMKKSLDLKKFEADKIVLLGLFALALLTAYIIVLVKNALVFTEPIELAHTGLSIPVPHGNGWRSGQKWEFGRNTFTLSSDFTLDSDRPTARVYCLYMLNAEDLGSEIYFEQKAAEINGIILQTGQKQIKELSIEWAQIEQPEFGLKFFIATAELPYNRRLNIEVRQIADTVDTAQEVFNRIIDSIDFEDNRLFEAGSETVETMKNKGLQNLINEGDRQAYYLIKDSKNQNIGFLIDVLIDSRQNTEFNIKAASYFYRKGLREQAMLFQCANNLGKFFWESETNNSSGINKTTVVLEENDILTVRQTLTQTESKHRLSPMAIPDIFLEQLFNQIIESNTKQIIVDLIDADAKITPTIVSVVEQSDDAAAGSGAAYTIKLEFLDGQDFSELIYLDNNRQIEKVILHQNNTYTLETSTRSQIIQEFPERADFISQRSNMLEGNI
ncbi:MAG: hypothetical protein JW715_05610 [Sedimentisphaerales bacterium]|nr:hypothetical protein [Sedimentisphaerales bacterium]